MISTHRRALVVLVCITVACVLYLSHAVSLRQAGLFCVGIAIGIAAYHSNFSFPGAWRMLIVERRGDGVRAHALMLAVGVALFVPALEIGSIFGLKLNPANEPVSVSVFVGAFISGIGMQLSSRCACGVLYSATGINSVMIATMLAFVVGSVVATSHAIYWMSWPSLGTVSLLSSWGPFAAIVSSWVALGLVVIVSIRAERRRHGSVDVLSAARVKTSFLRGPWTIWAGAMALALLNFLTLLASGYAWHVTSAFALWGAKTAQSFGIDVSRSAYWSLPDNVVALTAPISHDIASVMNVGIIMGGMTAAALAGRFAPRWRVPVRPLAAAAFGGLLLGYGARLAYGSNVGAYFSGIVSSSLHGWLWVLSAVLGSIVGIRIRPLIGLPIEGSSPSENC